MNRRVASVTSALFFLGLVATVAAGSPRSIPAETFPAPFGVNIHYTKGAPGETAMLARSFRVVRMDIAWGATERERGRYNFTAYDALIRELDAHGVTPLFILAYGNDLYQKGAPRTPEARAAFVRWASAVAGRYRNRKIMWEFWNEPNSTGYWGDPADPVEYARLVNEAAPAMRKADPDCTLLVGATGFDWAYMDTVMRHGTLRWADAYTVHPYTSGEPETVQRGYAHLRRMLRKYAPDKDIAIISSEWGYNTNAKDGIPEERQAQYLVRQRLIHASQGVRTSIWYGWKDDGPDPEIANHRFGTVTEDLKVKPSYTASRVMTETLDGYRFARMLRDGPEEYVMLLRNGKGETALAMWTTGPTRAFRVHGPIQRVVDMVGRETGGSDRASTVQYYDAAPRYVMLGKSAEMDAKTMWWWMRPDTVVEAGKRISTPGITVKNTTTESRQYTVDVEVEGGTHDLTGSEALRLEPGEQKTIPVAIRIRQRLLRPRLRVTVRSGAEGEPGLVDRADIPLTVANPLALSPGPVDGSFATITLETPMSGSEEVTVELTDVKGLTVARPVKATLRPNQERTVVRVPVEHVERVYSYGVRVLDADGLEAALAPPVRYHHLYPVADAPVGERPPGLSMQSAGSEGLGGTATLTSQRDAERGVVTDIRAEFPDGLRYYLMTWNQTAIPMDALAIGMWVKGDSSGDSLLCRFRDSKGQYFQPAYGKIDWTGWRWITMRLDDPTAGSWSGPQDGRIHYPIRWDTILVLDSTTRKAHTAHIRIDDITLITSAP